MVKSFSAVAMASLISATIASPLELEKRQSGQCSSLHIMAAGGCHLPCTSDTLSFLSTTVAGITNEIPNSDLYLVPYDGSPKQAAVSGPLLNQAIAQYTQDCPKTPIVLVGYSLGGIIITNSLCGQVPYTSNIIASVTYGEETFAYPTSYDRGTCRANAPLYARNNTAACGTFAPVMRSYCDALDPNCCSTGNIADNSAHFQYAGKYDSEVAAYVLSQYNNFAGVATSASASATPSSSAISSTSPSSAPSSPAPSSASTNAVFSSLPFYANSSIAVNTMTAPNGNSVATPAATSGSAAGSAIAPPGNAMTRTITVTGTTVIPLYEPTGLTTPVNPTGTAVPNSVAFEPSNAPSGPAQIVPVGSGSGIAIVPSVALATSIVAVAPTAVTAGPDAPSSSATDGLTPFNPNGASSLALPGSLIACALVAIAGVLL